MSNPYDPAEQGKNELSEEGKLIGNAKPMEPVFMDPNDFEKSDPNLPSKNSENPKADSADFQNFPQPVTQDDPILITGAPGMGKNFPTRPIAENQHQPQVPNPQNPYQQTQNPYQQTPPPYQPNSYPQNSQVPHGFNNSAYPLGDFVRRDKSVVAALLLLFFLGALGVHRFYLDSNKFGFFILGATIAAAILSPIGIGLLITPLISLWLIFDIFWVLSRTGHFQNQEFENFARKLV